MLVYICRNIPTLDDEPTVNPASLTYTGNNLQLLTEPGSATGGSGLLYGYARYNDETSSPDAPSTWYPYGSYTATHDAGYYYIYVLIMGNDNYNNRIVGPITGSPKQIAKATGTLSLSPTEITMAKKVNSRSTFVIKNDQMAGISYSVQGADRVYAKLDGNAIDVQPLEVGEAWITVWVTPSANYTAPNPATCHVTVTN